MAGTDRLPIPIDTDHAFSLQAGHHESSRLVYPDDLVRSSRIHDSGVFDIVCRKQIAERRIFQPDRSSCFAPANRKEAGAFSYDLKIGLTAGWFH